MLIDRKMSHIELQRAAEVVPNTMTKIRMDFAAYGDMMRVAQSGIRQQEILDIIRSLPENGQIKKLLDLGCGKCGIFCRKQNEASCERDT